MENLTQRWIQSGPFFPKLGNFFRFLRKRRRGLPFPPPLVVRLICTVNCAVLVFYIQLVVITIENITTCMQIVVCLFLFLGILFRMYPYKQQWMLMMQLLPYLINMQSVDVAKIDVYIVYNQFLKRATCA